VLVCKRRALSQKTFGGFLRLSRAQNALPVDTVKKNPLKPLFSTEAGKEKRGYP
jgi:hypothetical protein